MQGRKNAAVVVVGFGSGAGAEVLSELAREYWCGRVELRRADARCAGSAPQMAGAQAVIVLDTVARGAHPGSVHIEWRAVPRFDDLRPEAARLLEAAARAGKLPAHVVVVGVEPGPSPAPRRAVQTAAGAARGILEQLCKANGCPDHRGANRCPRRNRQT